MFIVYLPIVRKNEIRGSWIGLNDVSNEGAFTWSDGSAVSFVNWLANQPDARFNELEDCVKIGGSKWNDEYCGLQLNFICQKP